MQSYADLVRLGELGAGESAKLSAADAEREFVATQGPLPNTLVDFWRLVWLVRAPALVMITRLVEKNKVCPCVLAHRTTSRTRPMTSALAR